MPDMIYNSQKGDLAIPEYGRNMQDLIRHTNSIEDVNERQAYIESILELMLQMYPSNKNIEDPRGKMWKHIYQIANYDLKITPPEGIDLTREGNTITADKVQYPQQHPQFKHYGNNVNSLIKKAIAMKDEAKKQEFVTIICNYMKLAYRTWNSEHYISDQIILNDLETLSGGKLSISEGASLDNLTNSNRNKRRTNDSGRSNSRDGGGYKGRRTNNRRGGGPRRNDRRR